ncbi:MAG TPA: nicotinate-nucleotide adenylyltransferase [Tepidisphaeraceae bacterium]|nr:nicotinate-nucleotide adenylyltransferase [Tepidisphaeraceae bacterium]
MQDAKTTTDHMLCLGGSFNPIHHGHLICARAVAEAAGFNRVLLIPSSQPPHKRLNGDIASAEHRLAMCRAAIDADDFFDVSDIELRRNGPSYTIETVRQLKASGWGKVHWLIGADMVEILPKWHEPQALMAEAQFVVMARPGWGLDWEKMPGEFRHLQKSVMAAPLLAISATEVRRRVAEGKSIRYLVPEGVRKYIEEKGLYR